MTGMRRRADHHGLSLSAAPAGCVVGCTPVGRWCTDELVSTDRSTSSAAATQCGGQGFVLAGTSKSTSCAPVFICLLADVFDNRRYI